MTGLVLLSGETLLGRSRFRSLKRFAKKASYLTPVGQANQVLGRSFAKRMSRKVRKVSHVALNVATKVPGISGMAQGVRSAGSMVDSVTKTPSAKMLDNAASFLNRQAKQTQAASSPRVAGFPYLKVGGGAVVAIGLLAFLMSKKSR